MKPAIMLGDHIVANMHIYQQRPPQKGEIVVFESFFEKSEYQYLLVKQVIAVPGDSYPERRDRHPSPFPNAEQLVGLSPKLEVIPEGYYFVRALNIGMDSDSFGLVGQEHILGRADFCYWPIDHWRLLSMPDE